MADEHPRGALRPVRPEDEPSLSRFLDRHPERDVYMRGLVWRLGAVVPHEVGTILGWFVAGRLEGAFLHGPVVVMSCEDPEGLQAFASRMAGFWHERPVSQLMAPRSMAEPVLAGLTDHFGALPPLYLLRHRMPAMCLRRGELSSLRLDASPGEGPAQLRQATEKDEQIVAELSRAVTIEELEIDPCDYAEESFALAMRHRIRMGREYLWVNAGCPRFRAAISAATPEAVLVEGVYVPPAERGSGWGKRGMHALCERLLRFHKTIVLLVGEDNAVARGLYEGLGFTTFDDYQAAFFQPPAMTRASRQSS